MLYATQPLAERRGRSAMLKFAAPCRNSERSQSPLSLADKAAFASAKAEEASLVAPGAAYPAAPSGAVAKGRGAQIARDLHNL